LNELITLSELARRLDKKKPQISRWKKAGKLVMVGTKVDYQATLELLKIAQGTRGGLREKGKIVGDNNNTEVNPFGGSVNPVTYNKTGPNNENTNNPNYYNARAIREDIAAQRDALKLKVEKGEYVSKDEEYKKGFELGMKLKDKLMSIPDRLSPILAAETNQHTVNKLLKDELHEVIIDFITNGGFLDE